MENLSSIRRIIAGALAEAREPLLSLATRIHQNPELGLEEVKAAAWQAELLEAEGFAVERGLGGLPTAFRGAWGFGRPAVAFLTEYDALPSIGHACGHNLIAACGIGAALGARAVLRDLGAPGSVVVLGCPGEEGRGGKVHLASRGVFEGLDAALMGHPSHKTFPDHGSLSVMRYDVTFHGKAAHAAIDPDLGVNALDAVLLLYQGVNAWRQHLPERCRVHGIISEGGAAPNIVPERASCRFYLRAPDEAGREAMARRFLRIVEGAALMTGASAEVAEPDLPYMAGRPNAMLNKAFAEAAPAHGLLLGRTRRAGRGSTDFGNVSNALPGIHIYFSICDTPLPGHSPEFRDAAGTPRALDDALKAAGALAEVAVRLYTEPEFRDAVRKEFDAPPEADA